MINSQLSAETLDLQLIFNSIPGQFLILDSDLIIRHVSDAYLKATLTNRPDITGRFVFDVFPENPAAGANAIINLRKSLLTAMQTKKPHAMAIQRYDILKPDGRFEERYWDPLNTPILNGEGEVVGLIHQVTDVTTQEQEKTSALRNQELLGAMNQTINDVVWDWNLLNNDIQWSDGFNTRFGYELHETEPNIDSWYSRIHPDDITRIQNSIHQAISAPDQDRWSGVYRFKMKNGEYAEILDRGSVFRDQAGQAYRMVGAMIDITSNKKAEKKARENEVRLRSVMESMPQMAWTATPAGEINYYNQQWPKYIGVPLAELYQKGWGNFMHPADFISTRATWMRVLETGEEFEIEQRYLNRIKNEYQWFLTRGVPIRNEAGEIVLWTGTCTYIDDQKKITQRLQEQDEKIQRILSQAPAHFCLVKGPEQIIDFATPGLISLFGNRPCVGLPLAKAWPEIAEQNLTALMQQVYETGKPLFFRENKVLVDRHNNAELVEGYYDFTYQPFRDVDNNMEGVLILAIEVTDQVLAKQSAQKLATELLQEKERFQFLADTIPQLIWTTDPHGFHDYFNHRWTEYTGYNLDDSQGTEMWNNLLHPDDQERARQRWQHSLQTGEFYEIEYRFKSRQGTYKWFLGQAIPMRNAQGQITKWFGTCTDIEEQKRWQAELIAANEELKKANADLDSFVYTASHDLKLPIISMSRIFTELTQSAHFTDPDAEILVAMFEKSLLQINTTIQDLTDIVKVQKNIEKNQENIKFQDLVDEVKLSIQDIIKESEAQIVTDFTPVPEIYFSRVNLKSIIYNLLSNAIKYRSPDRQLAIFIKTEKQNDFVVLTVQDNGLGINLARHKTKLFQMFKRFHSHVAGSGIGLYIINRIVKNNGGHIELESEVGQGSVFKIFLPFKKLKV